MMADLATELLSALLLLDHVGRLVDEGEKDMRRSVYDQDQGQQSSNAPDHRGRPDVWRSRLYARAPRGAPDA